MSEVRCSRRTALIVLGGLAAGAAVPGCGDPRALPRGVASACTGGLCLDLTAGANAPLRMTNGAVRVEGSREPIVVVRVSDTSVAALSAVCTHSGCIVEYDATGQVLDCPCHGSSFGLRGAVLRGPAARALFTYGATLAADTITIAGG